MFQTEVLAVQKMLSLPSIERWWLTVLSRGFLWQSRHGANYFCEWQTFYTTELLHHSYLQWCDQNHPFDRKSREELGRFMTKIYLPTRPRGSYPVYELDSIDRALINASKPLDQVSIVRTARPYGYAVGELIEARIRFTEICDVPTEWCLEP